MTQNDSFPKHLVVILYVVIVLLILTGCRSVSDGLAGGDKPQMKAVTTVETDAVTAVETEVPLAKSVPTESEQILSDLEQAASTVFINDFEKADFCVQKADFCRRQLEREGIWNGEERTRLEEFRRHFRREYHFAKMDLSKQAVMKMKESGNSLVTFMRVFAMMLPVHESMLSEAELWSVEEKTVLLQSEETAKQMLQNMDRLLNRSIADCRAAFSMWRSLFENQKGADYLHHAKDCLQAQKNKRFNWRIFGYCRDDFHILSDGADMCKRVRDANYVSPQLKNIAVEMYDEIVHRFSKKEKRIYKERVNAMPSLVCLRDYPVDHSEADGDALAWKRFLEIHESEKTDFSLGSLEITNISHR